jgi:8-oxo-dGTP pyrophosphatase MutT (NUDIX family)
MPSRSEPQAAVIAYRRLGEAVEICLIRRRDTLGWGIPKGLVDPGNTLEETALNEAWEEAGIGGRLIGEAIGRYRYEKWRTTFDVTVFLMEVHQVVDEWLESSVRERRWVSLDDARWLLDEHPSHKVANRALEVLAARQ